MESAVSTQQIEALRNFSVTYRRQLDRDAAATKMGDKPNDMWESFYNLATSITQRYNQFPQPVALLEYNLRDLWYTLIQAAKITGAEDPFQDRLVYQVMSLKHLGILVRHRQPGANPPPAQEDTAPEHADTPDGKVWKDLPFLSHSLQEAWTRSVEMEPDQRRNLAAMLARLASVGICHGPLAVCALSAFRDALENTRRLSPSTDGNDLPVSELLPAAIAWLRYCGHRLASWSSQGFSPSDAHPLTNTSLGERAELAGVTPGGFNKSRWLFWRTRLQDLSQAGQGAIAEQALFGARIMGWWMTDSECLVVDG